MSNIQVNIPKHDYKCIVVPSEKLKGKPISDYEIITDNDNQEYKIIQWVTIIKSEMIPSSLLLLSIGAVPDADSIFKKYRKSNKLYFFICEKINKEIA